MKILGIEVYVNRNSPEHYSLVVVETEGVRVTDYIRIASVEFIEVVSALESVTIGLVDVREGFTSDIVEGKGLEVVHTLLNTVSGKACLVVVEFREGGYSSKIALELVIVFN